eukprot:GHVP01054907.1.p1 GENE.GHVP01054907.1~~GHVP01054907.1.p1  ORF type:complete len:324 (+),score=52.48 GHVP01054907.1:615-1586(+)
MRDILPDLREKVHNVNKDLADKMKAGPSAAISGTTGGPPRDHDIESQLPDRDHPKNEFMKDYFTKVDIVKSGINEVQQSCYRIVKLKQASLSSTDSQQDKENSNQLNKILSKTNQNVLAIKKALETLKLENETYAQKSPGSSESRIRDNLHATLTRKFREVLSQYQTLQTTYKQDVKEKVTRQVKIVYPNATPEELNEIIDGDPEAASQAISLKISGGHESLRDALSDIQEKYNDIRKLENSVQELHQMFVDLSTLVDAQGELLDQIEYSVTSAVDYTEKAEQELVVAQKYQKTAKKRAMWVSFCVIILAFVVVIPLIVILKP